MKNLFQITLLSALTLSASVASAEWNATARIENFAESRVKVSVVQFAKKAQSVTYKPTEAPFGNVLIEKVVFKNRAPLFITGWAHGSQTIMFRIFDPENKGALPLCEVISFGESTQLRQRKDKIQLEVYKEESEQKSWVDCDTVLSDKREVNSSPKIKKIGP